MSTEFGDSTVGVLVLGLAEYLEMFWSEEKALLAQYASLCDALTVLHEQSILFFLTFAFYVYGI